MHCVLSSLISCSHSVQSPPSFAGSGNTLSGRPNSGAQSKGKGKAKEEDKAQQQQATWSQGQGHTLGARSSAPPGRSIGNGQVGAGGASIPRLPQRSSQKKKQRSPSPEIDWGVDDDEPIDIDSD